MLSIDAARIRAQPNQNSTQIMVVPRGTAMNVMAQRQGTDNLRWFQVRFTFEQSEITGWVASFLVTELTECPPLLG